MKEICFVVMPFGSVHRPALGVSLLKAALTRIGISSCIHYFNLKFAERIGLQLYDSLSETSLDSPLIGELIFAKFVFRTYQWKKNDIRNMVSKILRSKDSSVMPVENLVDDIIRVQELVPEYLDDCVHNILRDTPKMIGFTTTFEQNSASLALTKVIKGSIDLPIIFGGANCEGEMGHSLLTCAPWVDFVCSGEGDISFVEFIKGFLNGEHQQKTKGIITRESGTLEIALTSPVFDMDSIPFPDFDDYFSAFRYSGLRSIFEPELVMETSRGCWWGEKFQCTFCGLNGSVMKFRSKHIPRVLAEVKHLRERYATTKFQVVDNILDMKYIDVLFQEIHRQGLGVSLFYETKANISKKQLGIMKLGGVIAIQPGIESLSDSILKIMKKGVTALQNIQTLKWCREYGITTLWNMIWGFPGEPKEEYGGMAGLVKLLVHLHPPSGFGKLILDRFSPYFIDPMQNGIANVRPWIAYRFLYPLNDKDLARIAYHFDFDYSDGRDPRSYTKELELELLNWKSLWVENHNGRSRKPDLNMRIAKDLIMINDTRPCSVQRFHMLANEEAQIFRLCEGIHSFQSILLKIQNDFPRIQEDDVTEILSNLVDKKLMICDNSRYLSLAIPIN